ncbi:monocarboxylate uptake permease MctP [Arthrobacter bambusae]|uniref:monocarboxylate uptake permease MctP n=1 Tax=Arthrobacter bambusae TaxID=1338426 RepID=UPI002786F24C|nr:sodium:solute symporter [Arthrobacter bambusae]MDQ0210540.1 SSS family solute:Na+ symporter [Arthrobacter bambusae]MDQ0235212.1 SSS family solute:Na+ symporter [Arthrobacter bambusae]
MSALTVPLATTADRPVNGVALTVVVVLFILVAVLGFFAARWRAGKETGLHSLDEWGLGGRGFGTWVTWFLLGGDLYTAYTFVAVPAAMWATGAVSGFFAVPYTIVLYPIVFLLMSRLWSVSHRHGFVTPADFVGGRYGSRALTVAVALTGIVATMPYIALQLVGIKAVLTVLGLGSAQNVLLTDLPLIIAFVVLAAYTYTSGLRAPALIAVVKDLLIYLAVIVAVIYLPIKFGGWDNIFGAAQTKLDAVSPATGKPAGVFIPGAASYSAYWTLALGSAMALFMYPHSVTGVLATKSRNTIRKNAAVLPLYSLMLGFLALLGYAAISAGTKPIDLNGAVNPQLVVPQLFLDNFPAWFAGIALAAIAIGALVPAAIMSIAAANLFTRNIYRDLIRPDADPRQEAKVSKIASLVVKFGALIFVIAMDQSAAINMQLLGGIWILQTFPAIVAGLYTRWFHRWALFAGWVAGIAYGTVAAYNVVNPVTKANFGGSIAAIPGTNVPVYIAVVAFAINLIIAAVLSLVFRAMKLPDGKDITRNSDYGADEDDPKVAELQREYRLGETGGPAF